MAEASNQEGGVDPLRLVHELHEDQTEQGEYERVMADAGEDAGAFGYHHHEVEWHHHGHVPRDGPRTRAAAFLSHLC